MTGRPAIGAPEHTGSQELCYQAISRGHRLIGEIMHDTGLEENTVRNAVTRLRDAGKILRERNAGNLVEYRVVGPKCLLAEMWK